MLPVCVCVCVIVSVLPNLNSGFDKEGNCCWESAQKGLLDPSPGLPLLKTSLVREEGDYTGAVCSLVLPVLIVLVSRKGVWSRGGKAWSSHQRWDFCREWP
jgi:hypothetical protein